MNCIKTTLILALAVPVLSNATGSTQHIDNEFLFPNNSSGRFYYESHLDWLNNRSLIYRHPYFLDDLINQVTRDLPRLPKQSLATKQNDAQAKSRTNHLQPDMDFQLDDMPPSPAEIMDLQNPRTRQPILWTVLGLACLGFGTTISALLKLRRCG